VLYFPFLSAAAVTSVVRPKQTLSKTFGKMFARGRGAIEFDEHQTPTCVVAGTRGVRRTSQSANRCSLVVGVQNVTVDVKNVTLV
jgi:hypothetical protein